MALSLVSPLISLHTAAGKQESPQTFDPNGTRTDAPFLVCP